MTTSVSLDAFRRRSLFAVRSLLQALCVIAVWLYSQGRAWPCIGGQCIKTAGPYVLDLAQVRERHEMHIVCVHLNKDKCQISMAPGSLHVR